jgi:hypothetical protein
MKLKIWVNIYLAPYRTNRFYLSKSYPTKRLALDNIRKSILDRYICTYKIELTIPKYEKLH